MTSLTPPQLASLEELAGRYPELVTLTHVDPVAVLCTARDLERAGLSVDGTIDASVVALGPKPTKGEKLWP